MLLSSNKLVLKNKVNFKVQLIKFKMNYYKAMRLKI